MQYRKLTIPKFLAVLGMLTLAAGPALADVPAADDVVFQGPMMSCIASTAPYPCVSLTPPGYRQRTANTIPAATSVTLIASENAVQDKPWLATLKDLDASGYLTRKLRSMTLDFASGHEGAMVKLNLGPMKLNVFAEDTHLSTPGLFIGFQATW